MCALFGDRTSHQKNKSNEHSTHDGRHHKDVEVSQRDCLLVSQKLQDTQRRLLSSSGIAVLLHKECAALTEIRVKCWVERIERLVEPKRVKLFAAIQNDFPDGRSDAASFVAQQCQ